MRRIVLLLTAAAVLAVAACAAPIKGPPPPPGGEARFVSSCGFSHRAPDDPIVAPGAPGASHSHDFLGNRSTNAMSDYSSLLAADTTCSPSADSAAYWVPTVSVGGTAVQPVFANFYYRGNRRDYNVTQPFPAGLKLIAGTATATTSQPKWVTSWGCTGVPGSAASDVPTCPDGSRLRLSLFFPDCWDGVSLDSADHKSHLAYRTRGTCPASHPVPVPKLQFFIVYWTRGGPTTTLASGSPYSAHGDFFNAWDQNVLTSRVQTCINAGLRCDRFGVAEA